MNGSQTLADHKQRGLPIEPVLVDMDVAMRALSIGRVYLYQIMDEGELPYVKIGRRRLLRPDDLRAYAAKRVAVGAQP